MPVPARVKAAPALPSATVVLVREGTDAPEVLMVRRRAGDAFGDSYTFPGGVLDEDDRAARVCCDGLPAAAADTMLGVDGNALDFYSAAVRELFEETGILLAHAPEIPGLESIRSELHRGSSSWTDLLSRYDLTIPCDAIHYFAHWETPLTLKKRWSARFFLARLPDGQEARHDGSEVLECRWLSAPEVLAAAGSGRMKVPFPTLTNLADLAAHGSVGAMIEWARARAREHIPMIRPVILKDGGRGVRFVIPGDPDYPESGG